TLQEILAPEGTTVAIGQPVARIGSGNGAAKAAPPAEKTAPPAEKAAPPAEKAAPPIEKAAPPAEKAAPPAEKAAPSAEKAAPSAPVDGKTRASPMARHIAAENDLNLSNIQGSGPQGRVIRADVEAALKSST